MCHCLRRRGPRHTLGRLKLKLDENLPYRLIPSLEALGFEVDTVESEGLKGCPDSDVWRGAQEDSAILEPTLQAPTRGV